MLTDSKFRISHHRPTHALQAYDVCLESVIIGLQCVKRALVFSTLHALQAYDVCLESVIICLQCVKRALVSSTLHALQVFGD